MAVDIAIRADRLSKSYRITPTRRRAPASTLREALTDAAMGWLRRARATAPSSPMSTPDIIWALDDVSFEIARGEVVGIVGRNGAGKSTLLKVLSRITEPTRGRAEVAGRVGALLEVGTGFHGELTGRENIFLRGAILGMTRAEIRRKFDEIVEFAGVEPFLDTPMKRYSTGMFIRLAFAVSAHLEAEILIVDEVLAVGDAGFQAKCLGTMGEAARHGRTVLFVSHNMDAVQRLCGRCLLLERGRLVGDGATAAVLAQYLSRSAGIGTPETPIALTDVSRNGSGEVRFRSAWYSSRNPAVGARPYSGGPLDVRLEVDATVPRRVESLSMSVHTLGGTRLINADVVALGRVVSLGRGCNTVTFHLETLPLNPGRYVVGLWAGDALATALDHLEEAFQIDVVEVRAPALGLTPLNNGAVPCRFEVSVACAEPGG